MAERFKGNRDLAFFSTEDIFSEVFRRGKDDNVEWGIQVNNQKAVVTLNDTGEKVALAITFDRSGKVKAEKISYEGGDLKATKHDEYEK